MKRMIRLRFQVKKMNWILLISSISIYLVVFPVHAQSEQISETVKEIQQAINEKGVNWIAGETSISKLPLEERRSRLGGLYFEYIKPENKPGVKGEEIYGQSSLPAQLDWRNYNGGNWVTSIKDQGNCGSCWAFAPIASLESRMMIWTLDPGINPDYSEQFLVSCSDAGACDGGWESYAQDYMQITGVPDEACFPYEAADIFCGPCPGYENRLVRIQNWNWVNGDQLSTNVEAIKSSLLMGPVTTYMIVYEDFLYYSGGIYQYVYGVSGGGHCVTLVGWDDTTSPPCWIGKNSWGTGWGEMGFFKIKMGDNEDSIEEGTSYLIPNIHPVVDFTGTPGNGIAPLTVAFKAINNAGSIHKWCWNFGDGATSSEMNPIHTYLSIGSYTVSLTSTGPEGSDVEIKTNYITVAYPNSSDLTGNWIRFSSFLSGRSIHGQFNVSNIGKQNTGEFTIGFYLSEDGTTLGNLLRKITLWRGLGSGKDKNCHFIKYFSLVSLSGKYIITVVDSNNQITETDKTNNTIAQQIE